MRKNKIIYLFLFILLLFSFNMSVKADLASEAKEKSCEDLIKEGTLDTKTESLLFDGSGYDANCVYTRTITEGVGFWIWKRKSHCVILQLAFGTENDKGAYKAMHIGDNQLELFYAKKVEYGPLDVIKTDQPMQLDKNYISSLDGVCPLTVKHDTGCVLGEDSCLTRDNFIVGVTNKNMDRVHKTDMPLDIPSLIEAVDNPTYPKTCKEILGDKGVTVLKSIKNFLSLLAPVILIVMGSIDFVKAIFASDENGIKKAQTTFIKRLIIAIVIFLIPVILKLCLSMAHNIWPIIDGDLCGILE